MSYETFFLFSAGLAKPIAVPAGTKASIAAHVVEVEETLGIKHERYKDNPEHWDIPTNFGGVSDVTLCKTAERHNAWVRWLYEALARWANEPTEGPTEKMTPADAETFWPALQFIHPPIGRWTADYYITRMNHLYEVLRGRESEGQTFDAPKLTPKQAGAVIEAFAFLDTDDRRLAVPHGHDHLASSYDGGYDWCAPDAPGDKGGCYRAIAPGDEGNCRRRNCPLRARCES